MKTHYIVINGPPKSGRSTLARLLQQRFKGSEREELHSPLKQLFCTGLAMPWTAMATDRPRAIMNGRSVLNSLQIMRSHLKGNFGPDILAQWLKFRVLGVMPVPDIVIVDDILFEEDLAVFESNTLIRIIRGEERNFVPLKNPDHTVINANDAQYLTRMADRIVGTMGKVNVKSDV